MTRILRCICGAQITPDEIELMRRGDGVVEVLCRNEDCSIRTVAYLYEGDEGSRMDLVKMIKEFNMLFMGYEGFEERIRDLHRSISGRLVNK